MGSRVFIQRSRLGRVMFVLREEGVEVTRGEGENCTTVVFPLRTISCDYAVGSLKFTRIVVVLAAVSVGLAGLTFYLMRKNAPFDGLAFYTAIFAAFCAFGAAKMIPRFDFLTFTDHWKRPLFSIAREREQSEECDSFVAELLNRIERADGKCDGPAAKAGSNVAEGIDPKPQHWWKIGLGCGITTFVYPVLALWLKELEEVAFVVVLAGATGSIAATLYSYVGKERMRHWCCVGLALTGLTFYIFAGPPQPKKRPTNSPPGSATQSR